MDCQYDMYLAKGTVPFHTCCMGFGKRIREARKRKKLSQESLGVACGYSGQGTISHYENERREPTLDDFEKIAGALNVPAGYLAFGEGEPGEQELMHGYRMLTEPQKGSVTGYVKGLIDGQRPDQEHSPKVKERPKIIKGNAARDHSPRRTKNNLAS